MQRGFPADEFEARLSRAQTLMRDAGLDALLLTTEPEIRYFTGYLTRFWESPTRPWFLLVPQAGKPVAVIPAIGEPLMRRCGLDDIRTWPSPAPDDGVSLLADTIREIAPGGRIGVPDGPETHLRMPLASFQAVAERIAPATIGGDNGILRQLRLIKSAAEIAKIERACALAGRAFARVGEIATEGVGLDTVFRRFQMLCLEEGADYVSYLAGGAGPAGYSDVISPATPEPLAKGDILMLDTGLVWDGYFCDYDRNFAIGKPDPALNDAHKILIESAHAGLQAARPGITAAELTHAMKAAMTKAGGTPSSGRFGHGLGMQLTEWPSLIEHDGTVLAENMVLTLEPGIETKDGFMLVHEENIVITAHGARPLTHFAPHSLPVI
nr:Xaa-Pro peptidase family protein [Rhizobium sp. L1K21]